MPDQAGINEVQLFEALDNTANIETMTQIRPVSSSTALTRFTVTRKIVILPLDFHFGKDEIFAFDARLCELGFNFDLETGRNGKAVFVIKEVICHRGDGGVDYSYFPAQEEPGQTVEDQP